MDLFGKESKRIAENLQLELLGLQKEKVAVEQEYIKVKHLNNELIQSKKELVAELEKNKLTKDEVEYINIKELSNRYNEEEAKIITEIETLNIQKAEIASYLSSNHDIISMANLGVYEPIFDFETSDAFKIRLNVIKDEQKEMIKSNSFYTTAEDWRINGYISTGKKMLSGIAKLGLTAFNAHAHISKVTYSNITTIDSRISKAREAINKNLEGLQISIISTYENLKIKEAHLVYEHKIKLKNEREEQAEIKAQMKEEAKVLAEIEAKKKIVEKDQKHFNNAIAVIESKLVKAKDTEIEALRLQLAKWHKKQEELDIVIKDIEFKEKQTRAGYVYIISNIGSFGEDVFKIGMTRRLEPEVRINELGNASVPFKFDIHAMIFSADAPKLETALHRTFNNKRINKVNNRKEFFNVSIAEIEEVVKTNHSETIEFTYKAAADDYYETIILKTKCQV